MKPDNGLSLEERRKRFFERIDNEPLRPAPPKPTAVVTLPVSEKLAAAAKANPESVRVAARGSDGTSRIEGPRPNSLVTVCVDYVREVDANGRPVWPQTGAVHEYDPFSRL
jgi:hypothetical protein